jgi:hypothetical protein
MLAHFQDARTLKVNIVFTKYAFKKFYLGGGAAGIPPAPSLGCASDYE